MGQSFFNNLDQFKNDMKKQIQLIFLLIGGFLVVVGGFSCFYTVQPDEEAVIIRLGKYVATYPPGLHFKIPFGIDKKFIVKTKRIHQEEFGFRTRNTSGYRSSYSAQNFDNESLMLTGDLNVADVEWVVQFQISDPFKLLFKINNPLKTIRDVSESIMRRVIGDRLVNEVLTTGRTEIGIEAQNLMQDVLDEYDIGIRVVTVKLQDVNPPEVVKPSFNEVNEAKQEQEKLINQAEKTYNKVIPEAEGKAEETIAQAQGYAQAIIDRAKGDTQRFLSIYNEYRKAPLVTRKRIYLETMGGLFEKFENLTIVDSKIKGILPLYNSPNLFSGGQTQGGN